MGNADSDPGTGTLPTTVHGLLRYMGNSGDNALGVLLQYMTIVLFLRNKPCLEFKRNDNGKLFHHKVGEILYSPRLVHRE